MTDDEEQASAKEGEDETDNEEEEVQLQADLQTTIFLSKTGLMLEQATGQVEAEIHVAPVLTPFQHGKPFVTEEEEKSLGTQMFNLHRWYLCKLNICVPRLFSSSSVTKGFP